MSLTQKDIEKIMGLLEQSQFDHMNLEMDGLKLELTRRGAQPEATSSAAPPSKPAKAERPKPEPAKPVPAHKPRQSTEEGLIEITSPLLGVFYRAPKPGEDPFVDVGSQVSDETVIGIIEVMKLMNSARAKVSGEVVEILAENGEMVEFGEVLMLVRPDS